MIGGDFPFLNCNSHFKNIQFVTLGLTFQTHPFDLRLFGVICLIGSSLQFVKVVKDIILTNYLMAFNLESSLKWVLFHSYFDAWIAYKMFKSTIYKTWCLMLFDWDSCHTLWIDSQFKNSHQIPWTTRFLWWVMRPGF